MNVSDVCDLVSTVETKDAQGYETIVETKKTVFCNWSEGVSQNEFYQAHKAGFEASASVEMFAADYDKQKLVDFRGVRYNVIRSYQRKEDYLTLVLEEVVR